MGGADKLLHLQRLVDYTCEKDSGLCSTTWTIRAFYENVQHDLLDVMSRGQNQPVDHEVLTHSLYSGLHAIDELNHENQSYNDVRPQAVAFHHSGDGSGLLRVRSDKLGKTVWEVAVNRVSKGKGN
jgi:hypothetical protein